MAPKPRQFVFTYDDMGKLLVKQNKNNLYQDADRGRFDPSNLESVLIYMTRNATPELKNRIIVAMHTRELIDSPVDASQERPPKKRATKKSAAKKQPLE